MIKQDIISLAKLFIEVESIKEKPEKLKKIMRMARYELEDFTVEQFEQNGIPSILAYKEEKRPENFKIILNAHLDVVPGHDEKQFIAKVEGDKLYGRGSTDMKSAAAVEILAFKNLANKLNYPIALQLVSDEEVGGFNGTKYQIDQGVKADFVVVGEETHLDIKNETKGITWVKISCKGQSAHGAYPWRGTNALWRMLDFLNDLRKLYPEVSEEAWVTTMNLAKIHTTNDTFNKVPDNAEIKLDFRYIPADKSDYIKKIEEILPEGFEMEIPLNNSEQFVAKDNKFLNILKNSTEKVLGKDIKLTNSPGASDMRLYTEAGMDGVEFGPSGHGQHTDVEWVSIKSLVKFYECLEEFLLKLN